MTSPENFRVASLLLKRAYEKGLQTEVFSDRCGSYIQLLEVVKDNTRYPMKVCLYQSVEECLAFLDGYQAKQLHAAMPEEQSSGG
jgi:hypothetical protein